MNAIHHVTDNVTADANFAASATGIVQPFSKFDVLETGFWEEMYCKAKKLDTALEVLNTMQHIVQEPCYEESDRVVLMVDTAMRIARRTLSLH